MRSRLKSFGITLGISFGVSLIIFGLVACILVPSVLSLLSPFTGKNEGTVEETTQQSLETDSKTGVKGQGFSAVLIGTDYQPKVTPDQTSHSDMIIFININDKTNHFVYMAIPSVANVTVDGSTMSLSEVYHEKNIEYLCDKIAELTGVSVDYYAITSIPKMEEIVDELGGIDFSVPVNMQYEDSEQNLKIDISSGYCKLDGENAVKMLRYKSDSYEDRMSRNVDFIQTVIKTFTGDIYKDEAIELYNKIAQNITTNFTEEDLIKYMDLLWSYSSFDEIKLDYPGKYITTSDTNSFEPDTNSAFTLLAE